MPELERYLVQVRVPEVLHVRADDSAARSFPPVSELVNFLAIEEVAYLSAFKAIVALLVADISTACSARPCVKVEVARGDSEGAEDSAEPLVSALDLLWVRIVEHLISSHLGVVPADRKGELNHVHT